MGNQIGQYCYRAYQGRDTVCERCQIAMCFEDGKTHKVEQKRVTDEGTSFSENLASPLRNSEGHIIAGIEIVRDITERKLLEIKIINDKDELELRVAERTAKLIESNKALAAEVRERKRIEKNLRLTKKSLLIHLNELKEANIALKVLIKQREEDKKEFELNILSNIKHLILPYIKKLKKNRAMSEELSYLNILESNLMEIVSPFSSLLSSSHVDMSPKEIQVANLIKDGKRDKEIMDILNISLDTVKTHRRNIRKKMGIYGKRANLRITLTSSLK